MRYPYAISTASFVLILLLFTYACRRSEEGPQISNAGYTLQVPAGFPAPYLSDFNPLTRAGVELGRMLYYDTLLSSGGPQSGNACASCHLQKNGFALPGRAVLPHINLSWNRHFLWKGEVAGSLEDIMMFEVRDFFATDTALLNARDDYRSKFAAVFGSTDISSRHIAYALAQFIRTLVSGNSTYDKFMRGEVALNATARRGYELFFSEKGDCFHCHGNALFSDNDFHNIGLKTRSYGDMGRYLVSGSASDIGKFKTPTLRNVALRNAYMHDGRFTTLTEVVEHYNTGLQRTDYLDPILNHQDIDLSPSEVNDLVAFLHTLTDSTFISDPAFSAP